MDADVIVVGAGLAGLVAACEAADAGRRVLLVDQEGPQSLGGQAHWSFGGLFLVDSPEQRLLRVRDSIELARQDWFSSAALTRDDDTRPREWAEAYLDFAAGEKRSWLRSLGVRFFPVVAWAERRVDPMRGRGNSVPRFHITWGTGPGLVEPFARRVRAHADTGQIRLLFRHRVDELLLSEGAVTGVRASILAPDEAPRGVATNREVIGEAELQAPATVVCSGGIGGDLDQVRASWPNRLGSPPASMVRGVPEYVDGRLMAIAEASGARVIGRDRMWHYVEGLRNHSPVWRDHGIRILPGPSALWLDAYGERLPAPFLPGADTLGTLGQLRSTGMDHSWFVLSGRIAEKEIALSGSEQNPDLTDRSVRLLAQRLRPGPPAPVQAFLDRGADVVRATNLDALVAGMNALVPTGPPLDPARIRTIVERRDAAIAAGDESDPQVALVLRARRYLGDRLIRVAAPHRLLDPAAGGLIAIRLNLLSRKTLGGLETDLDGRCLRADGSVIDGLFAAGEAAGFGGGGMMGDSALEGTFLGGCLFSGRVAGRAAAR